MMMINTNLGVSLLALFATCNLSTAADGADNNVHKKRTVVRQQKRKLRKGNHIRNNDSRRLGTKHLNKDSDITEDVAFWTRTLQGSIPNIPVTPNPTRRPTRNPTNRPQANATPPPTRRTTPNPTRNPTPPPTRRVTPNPTRNPTPNPTNPPAPTPPSGGAPVANDDTFTMSVNDGVSFVAVLDNDIPAAGESLIVKSIVTQAGGGADCTISLELTEVVYTPAGAGTESCVYEACDDANACDTATLTVTTTA